VTDNQLHKYAFHHHNYLNHKSDENHLDDMHNKNASINSNHRILSGKIPTGELRLYFEIASSFIAVYSIYHL